MRRGKKVGSTLPKRDVNVIFNRRAAILSIGGGVVMGAIGVRLAQLQATNLFNQEYTMAADENRFDTRIIAPPRGIIYDRFGTVLAQTSKDYQVSVVQEDAEDLEGVIARVGEILSLGPDWPRRALIRVRERPRYEPAQLKAGLNWEEFNAINVRLPELRGVVADSTDVRAYPFDVVFAHPIGYVQKPTQRDVERAQAPENGPEGQRRSVYLRNPDVRVGKAGLEAEMETTLHGDAGWRKVIVNAFGREMGEDVNERREPVRGSGVVLTIDAELQRTAMQCLGDQAGAAVVMDIYTGDLLVMASNPSFDPNMFVNGIGQNDFAALNGDEKKPLFNKAVTGTYPPGSTFKSMVGIAAKRAGVEDDWHVNCPGYFPYGGRNFHCWKRGGHGSTNMHKAMRESCDVYFYNAALRAGPERIAAIAREFGFGVKHDVSVPNVKAGLVPDPTWWRENRNEGWTGGLTLNYGIGQGALQVTPLQLCVMAARIGNNGKAVVPRLVREAPGIAEAGQPPNMHDVAPEHLAALRQGMYGVCNEPGGTATRAGNLIQLVRRPDGAMVEASEGEPGWEPVRIAGKTGTSQVRVISAAERARGVIRDADLPWRLRDNALFVSFGPWDNPRYACAVVLEHGGHINTTWDAAPISAAILRETFKRDPANRASPHLATLEAHLRGEA
jgi:penicillin-binding protein 2